MVNIRTMKNILKKTESIVCGVAGIIINILNIPIILLLFMNYIGNQSYGFYDFDRPSGKESIQYFLDEYLPEMLPMSVRLYIAIFIYLALMIMIRVTNN